MKPIPVSRVKNEDGMMLVIAILLLTVMAILIPMTIFKVQQEAKLVTLQTRSSRAFHLAEAAVDRGHLQLTVSTANWSTILAGGSMSGHNFDTRYNDLDGGHYSIKIYKGAGDDKAVVLGVGRDDSTKEVRAVEAIYQNTNGKSSIYAVGGVTVGGNVTVEWGAIFSPSPIDSNGNLHPQFKGASTVDLDANGADPPNTDGIQWWSFYNSIPPEPQITLDSYASSATANGIYCASSTVTMKDYTHTGGKVHYFTGDLDLQSGNCPTCNGCSGGGGSNDVFIDGSIVVLGNLNIHGGTGGGSYNAYVPQSAWKQYGNDWSFYRTTYDGSAPAGFPGVDGSYSSSASLTYPLSSVLVHGFIYVGGDLDLTGGGNVTVHGYIYVKGDSNISTSNMQVFYDETVGENVIFSRITMERVSWRETEQAWPSGI
ncbi:MAG: hypothetical protein A3G41_07560 [Elusimicrobia bacterium RIFCSPLOWO2_12_FULL_59_9]|nr:MAG: hypothetical protein A3G41_07560 [Elusimicrobia bacterium RIFCSPLOWO2_12_FULL_59_9]